VTLDGVNLAHNQVVIQASGFIQFSLGVVGFRIEGSITVSVSGTGFQITVNGILTAKLGSVTLLRLNASGGLKIVNAGDSQPPFT
jgi:hypothetical protein